MTNAERTVRRVLVIGAHPDDIEFGVAGAVATWTDAGVEVVYCIVTDGAAGSNDPTVDTAALVTLRRDEQLAAAACVGVRDVRFLGHADGTLEPTMALRRELTRLIRELRPERVVITDPTTFFVDTDEFHYINHPDHRAAAEAALYAIFPSAETRPIFRELLDEGLEPHHVNEVWMTLTLRPNHAVDISAVYERKIEALMRHRSQLGTEPPAFVRVSDHAQGEKMGVEYAEEFRVLNFYDDRPPAGDALS